MEICKRSSSLFLRNYRYFVQLHIYKNFQHFTKLKNPNF